MTRTPIVRRPFRQRAAFLPALLGALCIAPAAASAAAGPGASPSVVFSPLSAEFVARPGERLLQEFTVTNNGERPLELSLTTADVWHAGGRRTFPSPGSAPRGAGAWLVAPPASLVVPPGETRSFSGAARVPEGTAPGSYFGAYLARVEGGDVDDVVPKRQIAARARMNLQFALALIVRVPDSRGELAAAELSVVDAGVVEAGASRPLVVRATVANDSISDARTEGSLVLFDSAGRPLGRSGFSRSLLLPGERREFSTTLALPLASGDYRAVLAFAGADSRAAVHDLRFTVDGDVDVDAPEPPRPPARPTPRGPPAHGPREPGSVGR